MEDKSLKDLSQSIDDIFKKYDIDGFVSEFKRSVKTINKKAHEEMEALYASDMAEGSHFDKIMNVTNTLSDEDMAKVVKVSKRLNKKYNFEKFSEEAEAARRHFLSKRTDYFSIKASFTERDGMFTSYMDQTGIGDLMLASWINRLLERIYPYCLRIKYEDLNGGIVETRISHREFIFTPQYIEGPLITRYHGKSNYDRFVLHSFYDVNKSAWVYVPMRLIIDLTSPEGINIYDIDIPTDQ